MTTTVLLILILIITALLPLFVKKVEDNLEPFLFVMGLCAAIVSKVMNAATLEEIFSNKLLYLITAAVLIVSFLFKIFEDKVGKFNDYMLSRVPLKVVVFLIVVGLGLLSSIITAIVSSLLLTELVSLLPINRKNKIRVSIIACFSIGLGAVLTPIGEPLSTIVVSRLHKPFAYMIDLLGVYVIIGVVLLGLLAAFFVDNGWKKKFKANKEAAYIPDHETAYEIVMRAIKIFVFVVGLDLLGYGFQPIVDRYVIHWNNTALYFANMLSAILDNATLAAAEVSPAMANNPMQITAILMGLLISGGMLVTGNIPNIVTAGKLKISMKEWAVFAVPVGIVLLLGCYAVMFIL